MVPTDQPEVLDGGLTSMHQFGARTSIRGRFVALFLGLRRMGSSVAQLGGPGATPAGELEAYLDDLYTKTHRPEPFVVLTAPFGQSTSPTAPYSARSGIVAAGHNYPTNTWRNNFAIQKGIGCPAGADVIERLLDSPSRRLACPHMAVDPEGRNVCQIASTAYRGEEHSIWLRMTEDGYQAVNLDHPAVYGDYLQPAGERIPIFPLLAVLYSMAPPGAYPDRTVVGIPDFASDFGFDLAQVEVLFDCDPTSAGNGEFLARLGEQHFASFVAEEREAYREGGVTETTDRPAGPLPTAFVVGQLNTGVGATLAVANDLGAQGWNVLYRANQPRVGYDLEATREDARIRVEVKSSISFAVPELTEAEWESAQRYGDEYVLAVVDFFGSDQQSIWYVRDPASGAIPTAVPTTMYRLARADLQGLATEAEFL